ncbi:hypothetical protein M3J09_006631 [Ascochyta lentis]
MGNFPLYSCGHTSPTKSTFSQIQNGLYACIAGHAGEVAHDLDPLFFETTKAGTHTIFLI